MAAVRVLRNPLTTTAINVFDGAATGCSGTVNGIAATGLGDGAYSVSGSFVDGVIILATSCTDSDTGLLLPEMSGVSQSAGGVVSPITTLIVVSALDSDPTATSLSNEVILAVVKNIITNLVTVTDDQGAADSTQVQIIVDGTIDNSIASAALIASVDVGSAIINGLFTATNVDDDATAKFSITGGNTVPAGFILNLDSGYSFDPQIALIPPLILVSVRYCSHHTIKSCTTIAIILCE
ncbi:MAG: hypothetical protein ACJAXW_002164 [Candidatus Azotimanducaceae bacterium]